MNMTLSHKKVQNRDTSSKKSTIDNFICIDIDACVTWR